MDDSRIIKWEAHEPGAPDKEPGWYWAVGIIAVGVAVASAIAGNYLLCVIAVMGGFAVMLAGSRPAAHRTFGLSDRGLHVGAERIPYANIKSFAIHDNEPRRLVIATASLMGTVSIPLGNADFRFIRTELKNRNIEEDDDLDSVAEKLAKAIGI
jgi:hypothetical protein